MININKLLVVFSIIIFIKEHRIQISAFRVFQVNGEDTILALPNELINIECKTDNQMTYCGFLHPKGMRYSYSGPSLNIGRCIKKVNASQDDTGLWRCHVGSKGTGLESTQNIQLKVIMSEIAALKDNIKAVHGKPVTIACAAVRGMTPLSYCRFEPPNGQPFNIDSEVTDRKPILNRYYFPSNKSLDRGDCAVTIRKVKYEDVGMWTCGAGLNDDQEHIDVIKVDVEGLYTMSSASATGITFGTIFVIAILAVLGFVAWKKRSILGIRRTPEPAEVHELERLPTSSRSQTPQPERSVPTVTIESPSEPTTSP